ncbi:unnamed protein product, partial [Musa acuminata subsp. burmannicoides]
RHLKSQNSSVSLDLSRNRAITSVCCVTFTSNSSDNGLQETNSLLSDIASDVSKRHLIKSMVWRSRSIAYLGEQIVIHPCTMFNHPYLIYLLLRFSS